MYDSEVSDSRNSKEWIIDYEEHVASTRRAVENSWEQAVLREVREHPERPLEELQVLQACVLDHLGAVQTGTDTEQEEEKSLTLNLPEASLPVTSAKSQCKARVSI